MSFAIYSDSCYYECLHPMNELERTDKYTVKEMDNEEVFEPLFVHSETKNVDIGLLYETPLQTFEMDEIPELKQSIQVYGLLTPLTVCMDENGRYEVLSGNRRYRAIKELKQDGIVNKYNEIPCMVLYGLSEAKKGLIVETTNIDVRKGYDEMPHRFKIIEYLKQLVDNGEEKEANIVKRAAKYFKRSERYAAMYKAIFDSENTEIREATEKGQISVSDAARMTKLPQEAQKEIIKIVHEADDKKVAKDTVKEFVDAEREKKQKDNTPAYKKEGAHQKQTQSLARNNISQMDKEDVKKMLDSDYFNLGITPKLNQEMDNVLDDIASRQEEIINSGHNIEFDYDEFSEMIEMLMSLEPGDVESDSKIADAISLCQQVAEKFSEL